MKISSNPIRSLSIGIAIALAIPALAAAEDPRHPQKGYQQQSAAQTSKAPKHTMTGIREREGQSATDARREGIIWTTFATNPNLRESGVEVEVRQGTAILSGTVESRVERDLAEELARNVSGINRVDNRLEIDAEHRPIARRAPVDAGDRRAERDFGTVVSDATTTAQVKSKLLWNANTSGLDINVDTWHGHVTLSGTVDDEAEKQLAERLARNTGNVVAVENQLRVDPTATVARRDGTARTMTDARTDARPLDRRDDRIFAADQDQRPATVRRDDRDDEELARLRREQDRLAAEQPRRTAERDSDQPVNDAWITTKVKSTLLFSRNVDGMDVEVETRNGVVNLTGTVESSAMRQAAIDLARDIRGVRDVNANALQVSTGRAVAATEDDD
jgi:hyperosmotically inducible periplasmic protein